VVRALDPWPHSGAGRFHRGISLVIMVIAALILVVEAVRNHDPLELVVLGAMFWMVALVAWHLHAAFRASPANFPVPSPVPPYKTPADSLRTGYRKSKEANR
jgi:hypothetical protein